MILIVGLSCLGLSEKSSVITILREGEPLLNLKTNHFDAGACVNGFPPCGACHFLFVALLSHVIQLIIETGHYIFEFSSTNLPTSFIGCLVIDHQARRFSLPDTRRALNIKKQKHIKKKRGYLNSSSIPIPRL